ncbi:MAG: hypothetical protein JWQ32_602 [Marmoricola sp.]|nr:hypothetical protein [Marmoricola sp.]
MTTHTPSVPMSSTFSRASGQRFSDRTRALPLTAARGWRRTLTSALAMIWLLDAALQFQPYMFTKAFPQEVIGTTASGNPGWVHDSVIWTSSLMAHHVVLMNATFAVVQLLIALGLFWPRTVKLALAGSIAWALLVWWLGEGLGGVLTGPVSPVAGFPGAVLLYAIAAILLWPGTGQPSHGPVTGSIATRSPLRAPGAAIVWIVLWVGFAVEALQSVNRAPGALHDTVAGVADGEPAWIGHINTWAAGLLDGRGLGVSIFLATCFALIAFSVLVPAMARAGVVLAVIVSLAIWVIFQDFGAIATGRGTDPNSGLPLVLLALCYWPANHRRLGSSKH